MTLSLIHSNRSIISIKGIHEFKVLFKLGIPPVLFYISSLSGIDVLSDER